MIEKRIKYQLSEIIEYFIKRGVSDQDIDDIGLTKNLYSANTDDPLKPDTICYIDDRTYFDEEADDDLEHYPDFVVKNHLEFCYDGQQFLDVLTSVFMQLQKPTIQNCVDALNYYNERDDFLDFGDEN
ncbi:hypothetical protein N5853_12795 [Bartonella sp. HY329]|uniref:DUF7716 domain-containing protein n=1 Tax=unclassified Bartonella TaxID=2645622 RepID=UPI0021C92ADA|nr:MULTISPECIES: hypothetical protein [unclassified Bartonella]UXM94948.1 hypothetical protein N5853_12795 [Bartonella sp. HY329]UXN09271.1 hypothetical protein N5852_12805 [Bartonella sp. HY328]